MRDRQAREDITRLGISRLWYALDVMAGVWRGRCPNCGTPNQRRPEFRSSARLKRIWSCAECGVLYRDTGIRSPKLLDLYYTYLYANADLATSPQASADREALAQLMEQQGKVRVSLLQDRVGTSASRSICIVGCSWGYELLPFREAGFRVIGVEAGRTRREFGRDALHLDLFATPEEAGRQFGSVDVVLSSHVLEHIPMLSSYLDSIRRWLQPATQVHITPHVEALNTDAELRSIIGREHPLGVTRNFWHRYAAATNSAVRLDIDGYVPNGTCGELIATLQRRS